MPFTLAHPSILFPLLKKKSRLSATALIIGSMVPDIEFIGQLEQSHNYAHHFPGIFLFNIPVGLLLCFIFQLYVKEGIIYHLPAFLRERFEFALHINWLDYARKNILWLVISLLIGIFSHLLWDAFTHKNVFILNIIPSLGGNITAMGRVMPIYHLLQIISSVIGLLILVWVVLRLTRTKTPTAFYSKGYWYLFTALAIVFGSFRFMVFDFNNTFWDIVVGIMGIGLYAGLINSLYYSFWLRTLKKEAP